jgi:hypothetical protein
VAPLVGHGVEGHRGAGGERAGATPPEASAPELGDRLDGREDGELEVLVGVTGGEQGHERGELPTQVRPV